MKRKTVGFAAAAAALVMGLGGWIGVQQNTEGKEAIARAMSAVQAAISKVNDPERPVYHFRAPALWMNDPNGPIFYKGWYHLFYQFNPYGDQWGNMHWGHARSKDLVHWEDLPIALWPSKSKGEDHVFSGSTFLDGSGKPVIFYTSIGDKREPEQWAALPEDDELLRWQKLPGDPVLSQKAHGSTPLAEWRDPFLFSEGGKTYMLTGGGEGGHGIVALYRAERPDLTQWTYEGPIFQHPDADIHNVECPNIVKVGDRWALLVSVRGRVETFVGHLDLKAKRFVSEHRGVLAEGSYASQLFHDRHGRAIHLAWLPSSDHHGWNGCLALPAVLTLGKDGILHRRPVAELSSLRGRSVHLGKTELNGDLDLSPRISGDALEVELEIEPRSASKVGVRLRSSADGSRGTRVVYDAVARTVTIPGKPATVVPGDGKVVRLHLFLDKRTLDLFAGDGAATLCAASIPAQAGDVGVGVYSEGGSAVIRSVTVYEMKPTTFDLSRFR